MMWCAFNTWNKDSFFLQSIYFKFIAQDSNWSGPIKIFFYHCSSQLQNVRPQCRVCDLISNWLTQFNWGGRGACRIIKRLLFTQTAYFQQCTRARDRAAPIRAGRSGLSFCAARLFQGETRLLWMHNTHPPSARAVGQMKIVILGRRTKKMLMSIIVSVTLLFNSAQVNFWV